MPKMPMRQVNRAMQDWDAENDARTLANAHKIRQDKARHAAAKSHAKAMYDATHAKVEAAEPVMDAETPAEERAEMRRKR